MVQNFMVWRKSGVMLALAVLCLCNVSVGSQTAAVPYGECTDLLGSTSEKRDPKLSVTTRYTKETGDVFYLDVDSESDGEIQYKSENSGIASVDKEGKVKAGWKGAVNIVVSQKETELFKPATKIVKVTVKDHDYKLVITPATTKRNGSYARICSRCGDEKNRAIIYAASSISVVNKSYVYNGRTRQPCVFVRDSRGFKVRSGDYTVSYPQGMKNVGRYTITVKFQGSYKGSVEKTFDIVPKGTSISKVTAKNMGFTVKWKRQTKQTSGYEVAYSMSRGFPEKCTRITDVGDSSASSEAVSGLMAGRKYYVRIRTYKKVRVNGRTEKIYSSWSKVEAVTAKG